LLKYHVDLFFTSSGHVHTGWLKLNDTTLHFCFQQMTESTELYDFGTHKLHNATNETVLTLC